MLPSPTMVVVSLVSTTLEAWPRTSLPALSKASPTSSLITVPKNQLKKKIRIQVKVWGNEDNKYNSSKRNKRRNREKSY